MRDLVLTGFMGTGKTTVGRLLAERLALPFIDTDEEVLRRTGRTAAEIIREDGEAVFRRVETEVLADLAGGEGRVIALGGGAVLGERNRRLLDGKQVVCLSSDPDEIARRLRGTGDRPLLDQASLRDLWSSRRAIYGTWPQVETTGLTAAQVADAVADLCGLGLTVIPFARQVDSTVHVRSELAAHLPDVLAPPGRVLVVTDANVAAGGHSGRVAAGLEDARVETVVIPPGEEHKSAETLHDLYAAALRHGLQRSDLVIGVGGGVVCDLAGYLAATYMRGCRLALVPTTLLSQVDAAIGGKVGIDFAGIKNLVGAFYPAEVVAIDPTVLATLPPEQVRWGMAEIVKIALMCSASLCTGLLTVAGADTIAGRTDIIRMAARLKADLVRRDPFERGERKLLNFGHTIGHALETASDYRLAHGAAVAGGMAMEAAAAGEHGWTDDEVVTALHSLLARFGLPAEPPALDFDRVVAAMIHDKKRRGDLVSLAVPERVGIGVLHDLPVAELADGIRRGVA